MSASARSSSSAISSARRRRALLRALPVLRERHEPTFVVVNGENVAGGFGITPKLADDLFEAGVDVITLGNHAYRHREIYAYLDEESRILRPGELPARPAGPRSYVVERDGVRLGVINLSGNVFMNAGRSAFAEADALLAELRGKTDHILIDMHAEATSEKVAMGWHLDGRVHRRARHPHPRPDRRCARAAGRHRLHHRRRHDRRARRGDGRQARPRRRGAGDADAGPVRPRRRRPVADGGARRRKRTASRGLRSSSC